jgi:hypothetical protein
MDSFTHVLTLSCYKFILVVTQIILIVYLIPPWLAQLSEGGSTPSFITKLILDDSFHGCSILLNAFPYKIFKSYPDYFGGHQNHNPLKTFYFSISISINLSN